ncbi:MAG: metallophosphoesterase family protein [Clostridia bacterium]|nr:metallophosphoesterase family protein [Clostridia bacterium]
MRWLVMADIHGNMVALEAVLRSEAAQDCDGAISLGDHTNFGPESRAVQLRLEEIGAIMLRGNHEDRFARLNTPEFAGYNWRSLHWTHQQLAGLNTDYPVDYRHGSFLFTHGTPGDPYHLIYPPDLPPVLAALPEGVTHLFSGHSHESWLCHIDGKTACNPGSLGMREDNVPCSAPFAVLEEQDGRVTITRHAVPYDADEISRRFITTGLAKIAPEMSRVVLHTMLTGEYSATLKLVKFVSAQAQSMGLTLGDEEAWRAADPIYPWTEPIPSAQYWRQLEEKLL